MINNDSPDGAQNGQPSWLPRKFWDERTGQPRTEELSRSYQELERKSRAPLSSDHPLTARDYKLELQELLELDDNVNDQMFAKGFSNTQAQLVYDLAHEKLAPIFHDYQRQADEQRDSADLVSHFGSQERFMAIRPQLKAWGESNLDRHVFDTLSGTSKGVIALHGMMQNREPGLSRESTNISGANEKELRAMMNDPKYWRDRDPAAVSRVKEGFKSLYPEGVV
ncbi:MAG: hypothetical protein JKY92_09565 [Magnetovibrio sp.]|nr:hypothetical protein [Magnetovibrio sp.]